MLTAIRFLKETGQISIQKKNTKIYEKNIDSITMSNILRFNYTLTPDQYEIKQKYDRKDNNCFYEANIVMANSSNTSLLNNISMNINNKLIIGEIFASFEIYYGTFVFLIYIIKNYYLKQSLMLFLLLL